MSITKISLSPIGDTPRWSYRVSWRDATGRQHAKTFRDPEQAAAYDTQRALERDHLRRALGNTPPTFADLAQRWLATKIASKRESTVVFYDSALRNHVLPVFADQPVTAITHADVQCWVNSLDAKGLAPATARQIYRAVFKAVIALALDDDLIFRTPCRRIEQRAITRKRLEPLTTDQVNALAAAIEPRYRAMIILAAGTGARWSEAAGLTLDRLDLTHRTVTIDRQLNRNTAEAIFTPPKTAAGLRTIPLPDLVLRELADHLARFGLGPQRLLFCTSQHTALNPNNWRTRVWAPARAHAYGVPTDVTFHRLRHTYASLLIAAGQQPKVIQARLGHASSAETMDTYGHLYPESDQDTRTAIDTAFSVDSDIDENVDST
ncbi:MAG TPA: site-specific integrase [Actinocrinis sp.]